MKKIDIKKFDPETVCEKLLDMVQDMDYYDYNETLEQEKDEIINALYYLKAFAENPYNDTMFKTFVSLLYTLTETY